MTPQSSSWETEFQACYWLCSPLVINPTRPVNNRARDHHAEGWLPEVTLRIQGKHLSPHRDIVPILCQSPSPTETPELPSCSPRSLPSFLSSQNAGLIQDAFPKPGLSSQKAGLIRAAFPKPGLPPLLFSRLFSYCPLWAAAAHKRHGFLSSSCASASSGELSRFAACWPYWFSLDFQQNCPWASVWITFYILLRLRTGRRDPVSLVYYYVCRGSFWNIFVYIETIATWQSF